MSTESPRVVTRQLSWAEICKKAEGKEYTKPEPAYKFSGGRVFESTDSRHGGPYAEQGGAE